MSSELVDLPFSLVWVPGKHPISFLGPELKSLGTTGIRNGSDASMGRKKNIANSLEGSIILRETGRISVSFCSSLNSAVLWL